MTTSGQDPQGIDQQLDAGVAAQDHLDETRDPELGSGDTGRVDPDDTRESVKEVTDRSVGR